MNPASERNRLDAQYEQLKKKCHYVMESAKSAPPARKRDLQSHASAAEQALNESRAKLESLKNANEEEWSRARKQLEQNIATARQHLNEC